MKKSLLILVALCCVNLFAQVKNMLPEEGLNDGCIEDECVKSNTGVIGATCWSEPQVFATINGHRQKIFCFTVGREFYMGITMFLAKEAHIRKCKSANALDPAGNYPSADSTCYNRCEFDTQCIYGDNR